MALEPAALAGWCRALQSISEVSWSCPIPQNCLYQPCEYVQVAQPLFASVFSFLKGHFLYTGLLHTQMKLLRTNSQPVPNAQLSLHTYFITIFKSVLQNIHETEAWIRLVIEHDLRLITGSQGLCFHLEHRPEARAPDTCSSHSSEYGIPG